MIQVTLSNQIRFVLSGPAWSRLPVAVSILCLCGVAAHESLKPQPVQQGFFLVLLLYVAVAVLSELIRPKPKAEDAKIAGIGDFNFPTATEGRVIPLIFGKNRFDGPNVAWYGDVGQTPIIEKVRTGWFSRQNIVKGHRYLVGVQFIFCRGPNVEFHGINIDEKPVTVTPLLGEGRFDINEPNLYDRQDDAGGVEATCDFYPGSRTQLVSAYLDAPGRQRVTPVEVTHTATCPRYTNDAYLVARQLTSLAPTVDNVGAYIGNSPNVPPWRFELARFPEQFSGQSGTEQKIGTDDCNPVNVIYEIITNEEWGLGFAASDVDLPNFLAAAATLRTEVNGFSIVLDRPQEAIEFLTEVERQIDGLSFIDPNSGKWIIKLARADYVVGNLQLADKTNTKWSDYTKGSWRDTSNQIQVKYTKRVDEYKETHVLAQDMGNAFNQGGGNVQTGRIVTSVATYPGVKESPNAANIAWRLMRTLAYPLARVTFTFNREFYQLTPFDVIRWSAPDFEPLIVDLPMRITTVDLGTLQRNEITATAVQDVFGFGTATFGATPATGWVLPFIDALPFLAGQQRAIEAPRAMVVREPNFAGDATVNKVFCTARRRAGESEWEVRQRSVASPASPSGSFIFAGDTVLFAFIGELTSSLAAGTAIPTAAITITPDPDSQADILAAYQPATTADLGVNLINMALVGDEFMAVSSSVANAANVDFVDVYRGINGTTQEAHAAGTPVFMIHVGGTMTDTLFGPEDNIDIKLIPETRDDIVTEGEAITISLSTDRLTIRPYAPSAPVFNNLGVAYGPASLEGQGSTIDDFRLDIGWLRRAFDNTNEINQLLADQAVDGSTEFEVELRFTPFGGGDIVETKAFTSSTTEAQFLRTAILVASQLDADADLEVRIRSRHDILTEVDLTSGSTMVFEFTPTTSLTGQTNLGTATGTNQIGSYTAVATENHTVTIGAAYGTANVESQINGGGFSSLITAGGTSSVIALSNTDTLDLRLDFVETAGTGGRNFVEVMNNASTPVAYGVFH